jgi:hypothetical protein
VFVSLNHGTLRRWLPSGVEAETIAGADIPAVLGDVFGADPDLYREAAQIHARYTALTGAA